MLKKIHQIADSTLTNLVSRLGTSRDKATHDTFTWFVPKNINDLDNLYKSDAIAGKIIDRPCGDMLRQGYYFEGVSSKQLTQLDDEVKRLHVNEHLLKALTWSRLHGKAYIMLAADDNKELSEPMLDATPLSYITALSLHYIQDGQDKLPASEAGGYYNKPICYKLKTPDSHAQQMIHHSRIIELQWVDGESVFQRIYDDLLRYASVNNNTASLVHEAKVDVIRTPNLADQIENNTESIIRRFGLIGLLKGNNGTVLLDTEEEYVSRSYNFSGLPDLMQEFGVQTAAAADIPYTVLFGRSPAGMNSTGEHDMNNYYDAVSAQQERDMRPPLERLLNHISSYMFGGIEIDFVFNPLKKLDEKTRSEVEKNNSERDIKYLEAGILTEAMIAKQLREEGTYTVIDDEHIALLDSLGGGHADTV